MTEVEQMIRDKRDEEIALAALREDISLEKIERMTGLTKERIEELKEKHLN